MSTRHPDEEPDDALSRLALRGDKRAWRALIRRHTPMVYRLAARMLGPGAEAEDATQEAFLKAYAAFATYDPARPLPPWLGRITYHVCLKRLAHARRLGPAFDPADLAHVEDDSTHGPERATAAHEVGELVLAAMDRLSAQDRALITLRYMDGMTDHEVGDAVGMNKNTVRTRLHRARLVLQRALAPVLGGRE